MSRVCPYCQKEVHSRARRCPYCRHKLKPKIKICERCGREFSRTAKYCPHCKKLNPTFIKKLETQMKHSNRRWGRRRYHRSLFGYSRDGLLCDLLLDIGIDLAAFLISEAIGPEPKKPRKVYNPKTKKKGKGRYYAKQRRKKKMKYG